MTVAPVITETTYALAGATLGPFNTVWPYAAPSDVTCEVDYGAGDGPQLLVQGVDYVLTANNPTLSNGGAVTLAAYILSNFGAAWGPGAEIILARLTPRSQPSAFGEAVGFSPKATEQALDNVARQVQELTTQMGDLSAQGTRALLFPAPESGFTLPPEAERVGLVLGFDTITGAPVLIPLPQGFFPIPILPAAPAVPYAWQLYIDAALGLRIFDPRDNAWHFLLES